MLNLETGFPNGSKWLCNVVGGGGDSGVNAALQVLIQAWTCNFYKMWHTLLHCSFIIIGGFNMDRRDRLSPSQYHLFQKILRTSRERADAVVKRGSLSSEQIASLEQAKQDIKNSRIVVNLNLHQRIFGAPMIDDLIASRRLYNLFEIAHAGEESHPSDLRMRIMLEFKLFGASLDVQTVLAGMSNTEHPNYGTLDYLNNPIGLSLLGFYRWYRFVLKKRVKFRSTFTPSDSFQVTPDQVFAWDYIDGVLATKVSETDSRWFEYVSSKTLPMDDHGNTSYMEAQILGGVFLEDDVDMLYYPETDQFNKPFFKKLKRLEKDFGIELVPY